MQSTSLKSYLLEHLDVDHQAVAISDGSTTLTWFELDQQLRTRIVWLQENGCEPGERIGLLMQNCCDYVPWILAAVSVGLWIVPINWHLTAVEQRYIAEDSGMGRLLCDPQYLNLELGCPRVDASSIVEASGGVAVAATSAAGGIMLYTSGTTGKPKGVQRRSPETMGELKSQWLNFGTAIGLDGGVHLVTGPLYHAAPLLFALYDLLSGASLVIMPRFDAGQALALIDRFQVTHSHWVPTMFVRAMRLPEEVRSNFSGKSLTLVLHGAAPIAPAIKHALIDWWGPVLVEYWGGSESGAISRCSSAEWLARPGTVGKVLPQYEVCATQAGHSLPEGEVGLLGIRPLNNAPAFSYWQDAVKTRKAYIEGAMFQLGDIGYVKEGYVYLKDRESHTVISGGVNIYPAEIEAVLLQQELVADLAVFGVPDEEWGERLIAVIELVAEAHEALTTTEGRDALAAGLLSRAALSLASYKLPRELHFGTIERSAAGKVSLKKLREQYA